MGSSLPERAEPYSEDEVWASVSHVIPAIEVSNAPRPLHPVLLPAPSDPHARALPDEPAPPAQIAATRAPSIVPLRAGSVSAAMADFALSSAVVLGQAIPAAAVARSALPSAVARLTLLPAPDGGGGGPAEPAAAAAAAAAADDAATDGGEKAEGGAAAAAEAAAEGATAEGSGAGVLGDPLRSLAWLANDLARPGGGGGLRAGMVVITGAAALLGPDAVRWGRACRLRGALEGLAGAGGGAVTGAVEVRME